MKLLIAWLFVLLFGTLSQLVVGAFLTERRSVEMLDKLGFQNITLKDKTSLWVVVRGCSVGDITRFTFTAENIRGKYVTLETCEGLFKHATLRN